MTPLEIEQSENRHLRERIDELTNQLAINHTKLLTSIRFQLGSILRRYQWDSLTDEAFARELYVEIRRLQTERDEAVSALERVRAALAIHDAQVRLTDE